MCSEMLNSKRHELTRNWPATVQEDTQKNKGKAARIVEAVPEGDEEEEEYEGEPTEAA